MLFKKTLLLAIVFCTSQALATKERDGGNIKGASIAQIKSFIKKDLKSAVQSFFLELDLNKLEDNEVKSILQKMVEFNVSNDIKQSKYKFANEMSQVKCLDSDNIERGATSEKNELSGDICFDPELLFKQGATRSSLIGLAVHEHAHHYGFKDEENIIGKFVTTAVDFSTLVKEKIPFSKNSYTPIAFGYQKRAGLIFYKIRNRINYATDKLKIPYAHYTQSECFLPGRTYERYGLKMINWGNKLDMCVVREDLLDPAYKYKILTGISNEQIARGTYTRLLETHDKRTHDIKMEKCVSNSIEIEYCIVLGKRKKSPNYTSWTMGKILSKYNFYTHALENDFLSRSMFRKYQIWTKALKKELRRRGAL